MLSNCSFHLDLCTIQICKYELGLDSDQNKQNKSIIKTGRNVKVVTLKGTPPALQFLPLHVSHRAQVFFRVSLVNGCLKVAQKFGSSIFVQPRISEK
jgi:hypothetical protein